MSGFYVGDVSGWATADSKLHDGTGWVAKDPSDPAFIPVGGPTVLRPVGDRTALGTLPFTTAGGRKAGTYRSRFRVHRAASALQIMHANLGTNGGGANAYTQALSVEKMDGTVIPATYAGQHLVTIQPRGHATTDPITVTLAAGEEFFIRTYREVATSGQVWPGNDLYVTDAAKGEGTNHLHSIASGGEVDMTYGGEWRFGWLTSNATVPLPNAILGQSPDTEPAVALFGDSIMAASSDRYWKSDVNSGGGFGVRSALRDGYAYISIAQGGKKMLDMLDASRREDWMPAGLLENCQIGIINMGRNDLTVNSATLHADALNVWTYISGRGVKLAQTTITPYTTTTDGWATTVNQTIVANAGETLRVAFNTWLRDGAPILAGAPVAAGSSAPGTLRAGQAGHPLVTIYDVTDVVESATNSGIWKPLYTNDGIHPIAAGHIPMTAVIDYAPLIAAV